MTNTKFQFTKRPLKILITAGSTWVKIDEVRILTSIFTGRTGLYLAKEFKKKRGKVTLLINPHCLGRIEGPRVISFKYFADFKKKIVRELNRNDYDVIIHSAAVSDYQLRNTFRGKVPSGKKDLSLNLVPTKKIIKIIRRLAKKSLLIQFKLEIQRKALIEEALKNLKENRSDFVVANALEDLRLGYKAFLIDRNKRIVTLNSKKALFQNLYRKIKQFTTKKY